MSRQIRFLSAAEVGRCMPPVEERIAIAERTMVALVADADLPAKIGVHPRPAGSFAHAMPAALRPQSSAGEADLLGIKWVTGFAGDRAAGIPAIHALIVLSDPLTGEPVAILDGTEITAQRTAAVSGVAIRRFGSEIAAGDPTRIAGASAARVSIIGAGVQGRSHLDVVAHLLPGTDLRIHDRHPERATALADFAGDVPGIRSAQAVATAADASSDADLVISAASFAPAAERGALTSAAFGPRALIVAVDYATIVDGSVARDATLFAVDERGQFLANRAAGQFEGYPEPAMTLGEAILHDIERPASGQVLVSHLGVGLADVLFADAIVRRAATLELGTLLGG